MAAGGAKTERRCANNVAKSPTMIAERANNERRKCELQWWVRVARMMSADGAEFE